MDESFSWVENVSCIQGDSMNGVRILAGMMSVYWYSLLIGTHPQEAVPPVANVNITIRSMDFLPEERIQPSSIMMESSPKESSFLGLSIKKMADLVPFALVAACYQQVPNVTLAVLGGILVCVSLKNGMVRKKVRLCYKFYKQWMNRLAKKCIQ